MLYQTRKQLSELGDKIPSELKEQVDSKIKDLEIVIKTDELPTIKKSMDNLQQEVMKMGQVMYEKQSNGGQQSSSPDKKSEGRDENEVIDAKFSDK